MRSFVLSLVLGAVLCFVPLFDLVGYESSAAAGLGLGLLAIGSTIHAVRSGAVPAPLAPGRTISPALDFSRLLIRHELLQIPPLALLSLNAFRVQNCDPAGGLAWWLSIVPVAILVGQTIAWGMLALVGPRRLAAVLAVAVVLIDLLDFGLGLALRPPITGHSLLFGYFAGSLYDEALALPSSLLWYRASNVALVVALVAVIEARFQQEVSTLLRWVLGASIGSFVLLAFTEERHGIGIHARTIQEALGGRIETEHVVIYFSHNDLDDPEQVRRLAEDHEYRYWELARYFGVDVVRWRGRKLESYVYPSARRQHELMGALDTFVARPWTHAMHVRWDDFGDSGLAHEMAHLFTAEFGYGPFQVATRRGIPADIGLVEGIAVAADWPPTEMDPHVASAAMRKLDMAPKLERLFRPLGFWTQPNAKAYTLMASFVRWLIDTRGIETFEKVYAKGDFEGVYGTSVKELIGEWSTFVDGIQVDDATLARAQARFDKKSIFEKVCARSIAQLDREASVARGSGNLEKALEIRKRILSFQPKRVGHKVDIARILEDLDRPQEALAVVEEVLASGKVKLGEESDVRELAADLLYQLRRTDDAKREYEGSDAHPQSDGDERRIDLKERGLFADDETIRSIAERYLFDAENRTAMLYYALRWTQEDPADPIARYLVGYQLWQNHQEDDALPWLVGPPGTLPTRALDEQRMLVLGFSLYRIGALDDADAVFETLVEDGHGSRARMSAREWRDRVAWKRERARGTPVP